MYDIEFINTAAPTVLDCADFETLYAAALEDVDFCDDIGGLIVYVRAGLVVAVFDYENECAWIV